MNTLYESFTRRFNEWKLEERKADSITKVTLQ